MREKNGAAQQLGKLGGNVTRKRGSDYYKEISKKGVEARRQKRSSQTDTV